MDYIQLVFCDCMYRFSMYPVCVQNSEEKTVHTCIVKQEHLQYDVMWMWMLWYGSGSTNLAPVCTRYTHMKLHTVYLKDSVCIHYIRDSNPVINHGVSSVYTLV